MPGSCRNMRSKFLVSVGISGFDIWESALFPTGAELLKIKNSLIFIQILFIRFFFILFEFDVFIHRQR